MPFEMIFICKRGETHKSEILLKMVNGGRVAKGPFLLDWAFSMYY